MSLVAVGGVVGLLLGAGASRLFAALLLGLPPTDPVTFTAAIAVFTAVGITASYVPVRRATRVSPVEALRHE
jgi:ABC-type antimicrobial peptide transport system permease subunit